MKTAPGLSRFFHERREGWAFDSTEGFLVPASFFGFDGQHPDHMRGLTAAVFGTRADARWRLKKVRQFYHDARIVKIEVRYEVLS